MLSASEVIDDYTGLKYLVDCTPNSFDFPSSQPSPVGTGEGAKNLARVCVGSLSGTLFVEHFECPCILGVECQGGFGFLAGFL
ncbi:hypothetical protein Spb1_07410 [Planctopirus ephydatiae]|uniref:Uncharacterized protein n=1 Tax=Planctopirus ephydatiae TaxID=2528019 RepID=A0A518GJU6_9PLAN|nr:hypothetical protein Spb1_07410 [Planctopirus ephydatiae]